MYTQRSEPIESNDSLGHSAIAPPIFSTTPKDPTATPRITCTPELTMPAMMSSAERTEGWIKPSKRRTIRKRIMIATDISMVSADSIMTSEYRES
ncbi:hypothetical protein PRIPAC_76159 [Pristionchus pacificus]|uniref:Uncharacterized protein n=1 Tax=Pristionchus pacificus TaxID=54126 RepID=A0A2A6C869_PRIPA|nr:hypothetical protein PRIPAC_76159 [Pristionchus pacificus]|eukprot:PDM74405.1 hypothetical protein PRIPAC_41761 [Pristionchus pacificus]